MTLAATGGLMFGKRAHKADPENPRSLAGAEAWIKARGWELWWRGDGSLKVTCKVSGKELVVDEASDTRTALVAVELIREYEAEQVRWSRE